MLPTINGKTLSCCTIDDFNELLDNPDYRENEQIDYKRTFSILDYDKSEKKNIDEAKSEFRSDICSMANSRGGYLIYGIDEIAGIPCELVGVNIPSGNTDKFEFDIKNWLQRIQPRIPYYSVHFVHVEDQKYIVVLYVQHDTFAPYLHLDNEKDYRIYKRVGNSKMPVSYMELKNMFIQSLSLDKEISLFREERIDFFQKQIQGTNEAAFMLVQIIPETFTDSNYNQPMMVLCRRGKDVTSFFQHFVANIRAIPMVDGIRCQSQYDRTECRLFNNGVAESFYLITNVLHKGGDKYPSGFFPWVYIWEPIERYVRGYINCMTDIIGTNRVFGCISIIGCKGVITESTFLIDSTYIDRDNMVCTPIVFENIQDKDTIERNIKELKLDYIFSLGIRDNKEIEPLIKEVYGE